MQITLATFCFVQKRRLTMTHRAVFLVSGFACLIARCINSRSVYMSAPRIKMAHHRQNPDVEVEFQVWIVMVVPGYRARLTIPASACFAP